MYGDYVRTTIVISILCGLTACGGSGGGGSTPPVQNPGPTPPAADEVQTAQGVYKGSIEGNLRVFRGLRYAAPPVGALRFAAPQPPAAFSGTRDATAFGAKCAQSSGAGPVGEEDCLFLNIWSHNDDVIRPVLVFLHGGLDGGTGGDLASTEGLQLAANGNINVVTLNRRMSVFGGLALDELIDESSRSTAGNYGLLDVLEALRWLRDNVAAFGGDPNRVLVAGESAGGLMLCHILASPDAAGLMSAAIMQSPVCGLRIRLNDSVVTETRFDPAVTLHRPIVAAAGCGSAADILQCLRDLPASALIEAGAAVTASGIPTVWGPVIDGVVVVSDPYTALLAETAGNIPVIVGSTSNEGGGGLSGTPPADDAEYRTRLANLFPDPLDDQVYAIYPTADFASIEQTWLTFWNDWIFNCVVEELARSASGGAPAYLYQFSRGFSTGGWAGLGAVHAIDVPFLFETYDVFGHTPDADDEAVTDAMQNAWTGLAADPTAPPPYLPSGASAWPVYDPAAVQLVDFDAPVTLQTSYREGRCSQLRNVVTL